MMNKIDTLPTLVILAIIIAIYVLATYVIHKISKKVNKPKPPAQTTVQTHEPSTAKANSALKDINKPATRVLLVFHIKGQKHTPTFVYSYLPTPRIGEHVTYLQHHGVVYMIQHIVSTANLVHETYIHIDNG